MDRSTRRTAFAAMPLVCRLRPHAQEITPPARWAARTKRDAIETERVQYERSDRRQEAGPLIDRAAARFASSAPATLSHGRDQWLYIAFQSLVDTCGAAVPTCDEPVWTPP